MHFYCLKCGNSKHCVFKMGLETYTEIYFSVTLNLVGKNSEGLTVFILELDDVMVEQPKTTGYEFFILHDIDNIDNCYFERGSIIKGDQMQILFKLAANL